MRRSDLNHISAAMTMSLQTDVGCLSCTQLAHVALWQAHGRVDEEYAERLGTS